ncbi:MAG: hypothetical protein RL199_369 [Pseudomonadota bacterium]|jgi:hypothetical protein
MSVRCTIAFSVLAAVSCASPGASVDTGAPPAASSGAPGDTADTSLFSVQGTVTQGLVAASSTGPLEVGVLWLNRTEDGDGSVRVEATTADAIGSALPASFDVSVLRAPSDRMLGTALISYDEDGRSEQPVDRNRVAFGVVVVAPQGTFATLPEAVSMSEFISASNGVPGPLLSSFTYVSPFTVRYVKGASDESLTVRDINGVTSKLEEFTLFDVDAWARGIESAVCRDRKLGEGWQTDEVNGCIAAGRSANTDAAACRQACGAPSDGDAKEVLASIADCRSACPPERSSQDLENGCLYDWFVTQQDAVDAACGAPPDPAAAGYGSFRRIEPEERLTLPLGDGDIRGALTFGGFMFLG